MKKTTLLFVLVQFTFALIAQEFNYLPVRPTNQIVEHTYYTLSYDIKFEQPEWVAYLLKPEMLHKVVKRKDNLRPDPAVKTKTADYKDYKSAKDYDAGHMLSARNMQFSCESMDETFFMSNMSPQHKNLNRKRWADLEALERNMVERNGELYIVCGPILEGIDEWIGITTKIGVPKYYYKIILKHTPEETKSIAFLLPNTQCNLKLVDYVVTIDSIEALTGLDFFSELPDSIENDIESKIDIAAWNLSVKRSNFGYKKAAIKCK